MNAFTIATPDGRRIEAAIEPGLTLAQHLFMEGAFRGRALCSGAGRCGLCQARFESGAPPPLPEELAILPPGRVEKGWRLTCRRPPVPASVVGARLREPAPGPELLPPACPDGVLGIDLGTTSVHWRLENVDATLSGAFPNPQLGAGSEVMSRLAMAASPRGAACLRDCAVRAVRRVVSGLPCLPGRICLAGNTAMTCLALGLDVSGLSAAPYRVDWPGGGFARLDGELPEVYIPPLPAPFVGGDVSAGLAWLELGGPAPPERPYLLADLGTNGEFALALPDGRFLLASVPMGPALEGVGMASGMIAGPGAAVAFEASPLGLTPRLYEGGEGPVRGVSGTGYASLLARLVTLGALGRDGRFAKAPASPLAARLLAGVDHSGGEPRLDLGGARLYASDVEAVLKVKAAFGVAVKLLLAEAGLGFTALAGVLLAGAMGSHVRPADLEALGFFPPGGAARVRAVGNTSLAGACLAARSGEARSWLAGLGQRTGLVEVALKPEFQKIYIESMRFTHV